MKDQFKKEAKILSEFMELIRDNPDILMPEGVDYEFDPEFFWATARYDIKENGTDKPAQPPRKQFKEPTAASISVSAADALYRQEIKYDVEPYIHVEYLGSYNPAGDTDLWDPQPTWGNDYDERYYVSEIQEEDSSRDPLEVVIEKIASGIKKFLSDEGFI